MKRLLLILIVFPILTNAQIITTIAGNGSSFFSGDSGLAINAGIPNPSFGDFDRQGNYYFADRQSNRVRKIDTAGIITTIAGSSIGGYAGDSNLATFAKLNGPISVRLDSIGNIFIDDFQNNRIRKIDAITGIITTIAGNGTTTYLNDNTPATNNGLYAPQNICLDKLGDLYIADGFNYKIRKVNPMGIISTIAGNGTPGYSGEGTLADTSMIPFVTDIRSDTSGSIFLAYASYSTRVMKINTLGIMTTVAGNGSPTYISDSMPATSTPISPTAIAFDNSYNLFISDKGNNRAYKVDAVSGILYCVAGNGIAADSGDGGLATLAAIYHPIGISIDPCGNLYISTNSSSNPGNGSHIRKVTFNAICISDTSTNINNIITNPPINIYPNPTNDILHINNIATNTQYTISNMLGLSMLQGTISKGANSIDMQILAPGIYILSLLNKEQSLIKKIIKQ